MSTTRFLSGDDVRALLPMETAMDVLQVGLRAEAEGQASSHPRVRLRSDGGVLHILPGTLAAAGVLGLKAYVSSRAGARFAVLLFNAADSRLLAVIEADRLGQIRTGAASGVATRVLAREDAAIGALIGSGWQARSQLAAMCLARPLREVRVYSRHADHAARFCAEMASEVEATLHAAPSAEEAVRGADVITTATTAREPVLLGAWLADGAHVNAMGSNAENRRELDTDAVMRADRIVVDHREQAMLECGDLIPLARAGRLDWSRLPTLPEVLAGREAGRSDARQITLFESQGIAVEDLAVAAFVYQRAVTVDAGTPIPWDESHR